MPSYMYFLVALAALLGGYFIYGTIVEKVFGPDSRDTPAVAKADGVDYVTLPTWKIYLIQLLNIAGLGPVFGPILGALWGPSALLWIVIGCIFAGAVHDYMSGMLSMRYGGENVPTVVGYTLGNTFKQIMRAFSLILLVLVGVVFVAGPAKLLATITPLEYAPWVVIIFAYYFLATMLPIDKIIGRIYPIFGAILAIMAIGMTTMLFVKGYTFYPAVTEIANQHPKALPVWPLVFITIACGAISGFHATQSPIMARCIRSETQGRFIFYGGMIAEGVVALIWATVAMTFYNTPGDLSAALAAGGPGKVVADSAKSLMGPIGGVLAILGVVILPVTSGDTAFRAARLIVAETIKLPQIAIPRRLMISVPLFVIGIAISRVDFNLIWRYFGFANQSLAAIVLWAGAAYLYQKGRFHWICSVPAAFMTAVSVSYICFEKTMGFGLSLDMSTYIGVGAAVVALVALLLAGGKPVAEAPADA